MALREYRAVQVTTMDGGQEEQAVTKKALE
jgi:hypothetical protein